MDEDILFEKMWQDAQAEHERMVGRVVKVAAAHVGDGSDIWYVQFPRPIRVRISPMSQGPDCHEHGDDGGLIDTEYDAEALPGQLPADQHVAYINGPTYYVGGRKVYYWEEVRG